VKIEKKKHQKFSTLTENEYDTIVFAGLQENLLSEQKERQAMQCKFASPAGRRHESTQRRHFAPENVSRVF